MFDYENKYTSDGFNIICGIDEAGRGPLAGPVVAACVVPNLKNIITGINDRKKLTKAKREMLYSKIIETAVDYHVSIVDVAEIESLNILGATKLAMKNAFNSLKKAEPQVALIDAVKLDLPCKIVPITKGDMLSYSIACASILAKVTRDKLMCELSKMYPQYGFEKHKGYGTAHHIEMIKKHGISPIHRPLFVRKFV